MAPLCRKGMSPVRIDTHMVEQGLCKTVQDAAEHIQSHRVFVDGKIVQNPARQVSRRQQILIQRPRTFVSRGGYKMVHALGHWNLDPRDMIWMDIGASTGGFSDALLQRGAKAIYAVDVGQGLLHEKVRDDNRVRVFEKIHGGHIAELSLDQPPDAVCVDVSFIGVGRMLRSVCDAYGPIPCLALYKPQFECGRDDPRFRGVLRSPDAVIHHLPRHIEQWHNAMPWNHIDMTPSPLTGRDGNREFWLYFTVQDAANTPARERIISLVTSAYDTHSLLDET